MDPFSITASVLRITGSCFGAAHTLWEIRQAWKRAPVTVSTLCSQLKITAASLSQIQSLLLGDTDVLRDKPDLVETFDTTLTSCMVLSTLLEGFVLKIKKGTLEGTKATWKMKFKTIWNENEVKDILQQLSTQQEAINMLVGLLQMDSISEIKRRQRRNYHLLRYIAANTRAVRKTLGVEAPASIFGTDEASHSIFSQLIDTTNEKEARFEIAILSSDVYTRAFTGILGPAIDDDVMSDHASTVVDLGPDSCLAEIQKLVEIVRPKAVDALIGRARRKRTRSTGVSVKSKRAATVFDIRKLSNHKYEGRKTEGRKTEGRNMPSPMSESRQEFDRQSAWPHVYLRYPMKARILKVSFIQEPTGASKYDVGQGVSVSSIFHSYLWPVSINEDLSVEKKIFVCDLELGGAMEKDVDRILEYLSCPVPELSFLSKDEEQQTLRKKIHSPHGFDSMGLIAHCKSFKDLQFLASEMRILEANEDQENPATTYTT